MDDILEAIFEVLFEAIFETIFEVLVWIVSIFAPDYIISPLITRIVRIVVFLLNLGLIVLFVIGIFMLVDSGGKNLPGKIFVTISGIYFVFAILLRIAR